MLSPLLKKLLFVRQFNMSEGKIEILGCRHVMMSDAAILDLQNIDKTKFYDLMKGVTLEQIHDFVEHAEVYKNLKDTSLGDIANLSRKLGSSEGIVNTLKEIFEIYGLGDMEIASLDNSQKQAVVRVNQSSIANAYIKKNRKKSDKPVCVITAAVLAGLFSYLFQKQVNAAEVKCQAKGNNYCEFFIK